MDYSLDGWGSIPSKSRDFSLLYSIQTKVYDKLEE
jgi:hypothetical protein